MQTTSALSAAQARRVVLAASGFDRPRPTGRVDRRHVRRVLDRLGVVQIDSVNVLVRAHYMPFFSRLGNYDRSLLTDAGHRRETFEYWAHEASLVPVDHHHLLRWRMAQEHRSKSLVAWVKDNEPHLEAARAAVRDLGPVSARELEHSEQRRGPWWDWSVAKQSLEYLFSMGEVAVIRRDNFERTYCLPERAIPADVLAVETPKPADAKAQLLLLAARAHGVGTVKDLADYWRLPVPESRTLLLGLVASGDLEAVEVQGWTAAAFRHPAAVVPRRMAVGALVSPFDQMMWERSRVERVFGFEYRIEIYVPEPKRRYGYYVLPFLLGDTYVGRVDLKADRTARALLVRAAHVEDGHDGLHVAERLRDELRLMAQWLDLDDVVVKPHGNLAPALVALIG